MGEEEIRTAFRVRPPHSFLAEENSPALAKAVNGKLAMGIYLLASLEANPRARRLLGVEGESKIAVAVSKSLTNTPSEALIQSFQRGFYEPVYLPGPAETPPPVPKKGILDRIREIFR